MLIKKLELPGYSGEELNSLTSLVNVSSLNQEKEEQTMASQQERDELDRRARQGETVVPGGTGGKSVEAQENLAEGRSRGGQARRDQIGREGYQEMGRKGGLSTVEKSGGERAAEEGIPIIEDKFATKQRG